MQTPFETPYTVLHNGVVGRHTRVLRPYVEQLRSQNINQPVYANPLNRYVSKFNHVQEDTLEYWIPCDDIHSDNSSLDSSDFDSDTGDKSSKKRKRRQRKENKGKSCSKIAKTRASQIIKPECDSTYEFDSNQIKHLKQQMYLSLESRSKSRSKLKSSLKLPYSSSTKDIQLALVTLSGLEPSLPSEHFLNVNKTVNNISFLKYSSNLIDNLFFISIYKQNWNLSYKIFRLFINTYDCDILQIWSLGVHILKQLNLEHFKDSLEAEWMKLNNNKSLPEFPAQIWENLSFLQNSNLISNFVKVDDKDTFNILKKIIIKRKPFQDTIFKFIRLLMRTSGIQHPLNGAFPEQNYVPDGLIESDKYTETEIETEDAADAGDKIGSSEDESTDNSESSDTSDSSDSSNNDIVSADDKNSGLKLSSDNSAYTNTSDEFTPSSDSETDRSEPFSSSILVKPTKSKHEPIIIKNKDFNPNADTRLPHQQTYVKALHKHSTPTHRHGTRIRTPSYTLTFLWLLVRTGRFNTIQREIEPLLHIVPTSIDGRIGLADLMSRVLDLVSNINDFKMNQTGDFEKIESIKLKLEELIDNWSRWKDQFTSSKNSTYKRDVKQYIDYESVEQSIRNIRIIVENCINKDITNKKKNSNKESSNNNRDENDSSDSSNSSEAFVTADEEELVFDEDDEETRREMDRLLGYSQQQQQQQQSEEEKVYDNDDDDDEEVMLEMERLMGYSQHEDDQIIDEDDNIDQQEEDLFFNEYQEASQNNINNNYSDSE